MRTSTNTSSFIALAPIPIFIIDPYSLKLEYANARFLDLVNGSLQEIEGLIINDILGQDLSLAISAFFCSWKMLQTILRFPYRFLI